MTIAMGVSANLQGMPNGADWSKSLFSAAAGATSGKRDAVSCPELPNLKTDS
jgi:hypothetical protein